MTAGPAPVPSPPVLLPPPIAVREVPQRVFVLVAETSDPYERRPPVAIKVFGVRDTARTCRLGVRQGDKRAEAVLSAAQLREIAEHLLDCADMIDPVGDVP